jgi:hypothetical protein
MSDFIYFHKDKKKLSIIDKSLKRIYKKDFRGFKEYTAGSKTLVVSINIYNGFQVFENSKHVCAVIGGPVLDFRNNDFITKNSNLGTQAIYNRWIIDENMKWHEDLDGPFVVILFNKKTGTLKVVSDMLSFIPVFISDKNCVSTHINLIDSLDNCSVDEVSLVDFIINDIITFPYTIFKGVRQLSPASIHQFSDSDSNSVTNYWSPKENTVDDITLNGLKNRLRLGLKTYVDKIINADPHLAVLISGGEDSRAVLGMISTTYPKDCFIYSQTQNAETNIAKAVTKKHNGFFSRIEIKPDHIKNTFFEKADLVGIGNDCAHAHSYGFHQELNFNKYDAILGGFLADSFLKAMYITKSREKLSFLNDQISHYFPKSIIDKVLKRNESHKSFLKKLRPKGFEEWYNLFPITMNKHLPNIGGHRRIIRNYEVFTCSEVIKIAAIAPNTIKCNRILFQEAMKPYFKKTKWIVHNSGHLPYFNHKFNYYWKFLYKYKQNLDRALNKIRGTTNSGTWFNWKDFLDSKDGIENQEKQLLNLQKKIPSIIDNINNDIYKNELSNTQRRNILQLAYHLNSKD